MLRDASRLVCVIWLLAACNNDVDVGGPRDAGGGSGGAAETASGGQPDPPVEMPKEPGDYATGESPCTSDADCCVVIDDCRNAVYVVGLPDKQATEQAIEDNYNPNMCTNCISPLVQVSCQAGKCAGSEVEIGDDAALWEQLSKTHCGGVAGPESSTDYDSKFGCGAR